MKTTLLDALIDVQSALEGLARALTTGNSDAVLAAEEPLASAVATLVTRPTPAAADIPHLVQAINGVRSAVLRCEALGQSAGDFVRAVLPEPAYARHDRPRRRLTRER